MNQLVSNQVLRLNAADNVYVALTRIKVGAPVDDGISANTDIPLGHKVAATFIRREDVVIKNGYPIGTATEDIPAGALVHVHNLSLNAALVLPDHTSSAPALLPKEQRATFQGYVQKDGRVGTRNFVGVFIVSNCAATAARQVADYFDEERLAAYPNVDGVMPFIHELGCGMEMTGEPMDLLRRTISGYIRNPNVFGAVVIALGCERNNLGVFLAQEKLEVGERLQTVTIQEAGGIANTVELAQSYVAAMLPEANRVTRQTVSAEHLVLGVQSSAADGFSGITANPVLGSAVDLVIQNGGTVIFSETPELAAASQAIQARAATPEIAKRLRERFDWWANYIAGRDAAIGRLPRNLIDAGISSTLERAVDGIAKTGTAAIGDVLQYGKSAQGLHGLVFMDTPDYDPVSVTGQIAGGANLIAMTTGGVSSFCSLPAPTLKLASNSDTYRRFSADIDIDCSPVLSGEASIDELAKATFEALLATASGKASKGEYEGMGETEFVPWHIGVLA